ncbi:hypothetical protein GJ496_002919 [Pomphorhynchus laevis]|nr:hypothetical protein GJ496_002919 [Pomphorhynchus laevis]
MKQHFDNAEKHGLIVTDYGIAGFWLDLSLHIVTLVNVIAITLLNNPTSNYYMGKNVYRRICSRISSIQTVEDFWFFMETYINREIVAGKSFATNVSNAAEQWGNIGYDSIIVGTSRLRQLRILPTPCIYRHFQSACYPEYQRAREDDKIVFFSPHWLWITVKDTITSSAHTTGQTGNVYSGSGSVVNLNTSRNYNIRIVNRLKQSLWIDRATRAVFFEFTLYNYNLNAFVNSVLLFEFFAAGGTSASCHIDVFTMFLNPYSKLDHAIIGLYIVFVLNTFRILVFETVSLLTWNKRGRLIGWRLIDIATGILCLFVIVIKSKLILGSEHKRKLLEIWTYGYFNIQHEYQLHRRIVDILGIVSMLCIFKTLKYLSKQRNIHKLMTASWFSCRRLTGLILLLALITSALGFWAHRALGLYVKNFQCTLTSSLALTGILLSGFNYDDFMENYSSIAVFVLYICIVFLVLFNTAVAIINTGYTEAVDMQKRLDSTRIYTCCNNINIIKTY